LKFLEAEMFDSESKMIN